jgi:hypothetical protein
VIGEWTPGQQPRLIRVGTLACLNPVNHVGVVVRHPDYQQLLLFESTGSIDTPCLFNRRVVCGVQAHTLTWRWLLSQRGGGIMWHYPLTRPLDKDEEAVLAKAAYDLLGTPYDYWGAPWARTLGLGWLCHLLSSRPALNALFCSEFGILLHEAVGLFECRNPSNWSPAHWMRVERWRGIVEKPQRVTEEMV